VHLDRHRCLATPHTHRGFKRAGVEERVVPARELEVPRSYWLAVASVQ
jgi:hypothetical protein